MFSASRLLAASALGLSTAALAPVAANAQTDGVQAYKITHVKCVQQEDFNGADDAYLVVDGVTIWGPTQMVNGDSKDIQDVPVDHDKVLTLMEGDFPDDDDNLGAKRITGPGTYEFTDDGAHYTVTVG
jgi:hypothetical protein